MNILTTLLLLSSLVLSFAKDSTSRFRRSMAMEKHSCSHPPTLDEKECVSRRHGLHKSCHWCGFGRYDERTLKDLHHERFYDQLNACVAHAHHCKIGPKTEEIERSQRRIDWFEECDDSPPQLSNYHLENLEEMFEMERHEKMQLLQGYANKVNDYFLSIKGLVDSQDPLLEKLRTMMTSDTAEDSWPGLMQKYRKSINEMVKLSKINTARVTDMLKMTVTLAMTMVWWWCLVFSALLFFSGLSKSSHTHTYTAHDSSGLSDCIECCDCLRCFWDHGTGA